MRSSWTGRSRPSSSSWTSTDNRDRSPIACRVAREDLDRLLESWDYGLDGQEAARFLCVCHKLIQGGAMGYTEAQSYINQIKERDEDDADDLPE